MKTSTDEPLPASVLPDLGAGSCPSGEQASRALGRRPGWGRLAVSAVDGASAAVACLASSPLHLFCPRPRGLAVWTIATTHGGGLVAGDAIALEVALGPGARATLGTLSATRVYRSTGRWATQRMSAELADGSLLAVLPEPTCCFAGARFRQEQDFELHPGANLLLVDWITPGRVACGERWAFDAYVSANRIRLGGRPVLSDAVRLVAGEGASVGARMGDTALLATVIAIGPALAAPARALLEELAGRPAQGDDEVLAAASPIAGGGVYLRAAARRLEPGLDFIRSRLAFAAELLDGNPFERRP
jgi:urease accessory protein